MTAETPIITPQQIAEVSKRVGYDIAQFAPVSAPDEFGRKALLIALTGIVLAIPFAVASLYKDDHLSFLLVSFLCLALVDFVGWTLTRIRLHDVHAKWEAAVAGVASGDGKTACKSVQETLYHFRVLLKWRRHMKYTAVWTELAYLSTLLYAALALGLQLGAWQIGTNAFGVLAPSAFAYYVVAYTARNVLLSGLVSISDMVDPTMQICCALADIHKKYDDCSRKH